ncbi:DUF3515 domain-containing protein [Corynebacterium mastitidis]
MHDVDNAHDFNRTPIYIALVLSILAVLGAIIGARVVFERAAHQPVALSAIMAPQADSPECADLIARLPERVEDYRRAPLADPAPAGAAAWSRTSQDRVTLRCGINPTEQYSRVSDTETVDGVRWLQVADPDTDLSTWYTVDRSPAVAITAEGFNPTGAVSGEAARLPRAEQEPAALPLDAAPTPEQGRCGGLMDALPERLGEHALAEKEGTKAVWTAPGAEPIQIACGVDMPAAYEPGERLTQTNGVPWLSDGDTGLSYALGREAIVAAHLPSALGDAPVVGLSEAIAAALKPGGEAPSAG